MVPADVPFADSAQPVPLTVDRLAAALAPQFTVSPGPLVQHLQVWLDTADWRVHKQGATLHVRSRPEGTDLVLRCADSVTLSQAVPATFATPLRAEGLPPGELGGRVAPWLDVRALLPLAEVQGASREVRVLDDEEKTVTRLIVESPARVVRPDGGYTALGVGPSHATLPARVRIEEVRGYRSQARAVEAALKAAGLNVTDTVSAIEAFTALGLTPGMPAGSSAAPGDVDPSTPARVFVAGALLGILDELESTVPGTIADLDPEFLHDLRVAVRRSRSILKIAGDALPDGVAERFGATMRWVGDLTTPVRDLDVHVLDFDRDAARLEAFAPEDLEPLRAHLERHRASQRRALVRGLRSARFTNFLKAWRTALVTALELPATVAGSAGAETPVGDRPVASLGAERVAAADITVVTKGRKITPETPAEKLHALRKRAKELRYTLELFGPVLDGAGTRTVIKELKGLQDMLGAFQDGEVQRMALRAFADQMIAEQTAQRTVPVVTLLAMGELATRLDEDERAARLAYDEQFARFVRPRVRHQVAALIASPPGSPAEGGDA